MSQQFESSETIGEHTYTVRRLDPFIANDILVDVLKLIGPALGAFGQAAVESKDIIGAVLDGPEAGEDPTIGEKIAGALEKLAASLDKQTMRAVMAEFGKVSSVTYSDGRSPTLSGGGFTLHFKEHFGEMYPWLLFCFKAQYADFLKPAGKLIDLAARVSGKLGKAQSKSPTTSNATG